MESQRVTKKRNELTLETRYELVKEAENNPRNNARALAERFKCSKTQVYNILKDKATIIQLYESNISSSVCHSTQRSRTSPFAQVNDLLYEWYLVALRKNIFPDGRTLTEKARQIAERLNVTNFKASNGWLEKWKIKHDVKKMITCGESMQFAGGTVESWKEQFPDLIKGYGADSIWNMSECGCLWKALPEKHLIERAHHGVMESDTRVTIAFFVNALGEKEKPIVVWRSEQPQCFKNIDQADLPVTYFSQPNAWMTTDIMYKILSKLNTDMKQQSRSIILFMDNSGCHPENVVGKYTNIKVVFLPANTSLLQPLNLGILKTFKINYRKLLLCHVLTKGKECVSVNDIIKSITILKAIRWISDAWDNVSAYTIQMCFCKAGMLIKQYEVTTHCYNSHETSHDNLDDSVAITDLDNLIHQLNCTDERCSVDEYINVDCGLPVCQDIFNETWEREFFDQIGSSQGDGEEDIGDDSSNTGADIESVPRLKNFQEAVQTLEDIEWFLDYHGYCSVANDASKLINKITHLHSMSLRDNK